MGLKRVRCIKRRNRGGDYFFLGSDSKYNSSASVNISYLNLSWRSIYASSFSSNSKGISKEIVLLRALSSAFFFAVISFLAALASMSSASARRTLSSIKSLRSRSHCGHWVGFFLQSIGVLHFGQRFVSISVSCKRENGLREVGFKKCPALRMPASWKILSQSNRVFLGLVSPLLIGQGADESMAAPFSAVIHGSLHTTLHLLLTKRQQDILEKSYGVETSSKNRADNKPPVRNSYQSVALNPNQCQRSLSRSFGCHLNSSVTGDRMSAGVIPLPSALCTHKSSVLHFPMDAMERTRFQKRTSRPSSFQASNNLQNLRAHLRNSAPIFVCSEAAA